MKRIRETRHVVRLGLGAACLLLGLGVATAHRLNPISISVVRHTSITDFSPTTDQPIQVFTLSHPVGYSDLDLKTYAGVKTLERRVQDSVRAACRELNAKFPLDPRGNSNCARQARSGAMVQVRAAIAAAAKNRA